MIALVSLWRCPRLPIRSSLRPSPFIETYIRRYAATSPVQQQPQPKSPVKKRKKSPPSDSKKFIASTVRKLEVAKSSKQIKLLKALSSEYPKAKKRARTKRRSKVDGTTSKDQAAADTTTSQFWTDSWGEDRLKPPKRGTPLKKHAEVKVAAQSAYSTQHFDYTRRLEGLINASSTPVLTDLAPTTRQHPIARLAHDLDRVLFNPGVYWLQDPRSRVYNFSPRLQQIPKVTEFAFERLAGFIKSSRDEDLWSLAKREHRTFAGSTSSLSGLLSHIYFLLSSDKPVDTSTLSTNFHYEPTSFTPGQRMPASVILNYNDGIYAIDSYEERKTSEKNILTWLGTLLEKFLTMNSSDFNGYMRHTPVPKIRNDNMREAYRYSKSERFVMRSQLDCRDGRLPGTGIFDVKTRACLPIRLDIFNHEENSGYLIRNLHGEVESFEKEYYDLIRSAFLKYSFQVRIGNMDGVFVAYHNTAQIFGFQYVSLEEMDARLFGPQPGLGNRIFEKCLNLLECVADEIIRTFPEQSVKCTFETLEGSGMLKIWAEPAAWDSLEPRPIKQLITQVKHRLDSAEVDAHQALKGSHEGPWGVHWSVSWASKPDEQIREELDEAKERQFHAYNLPTGIDFEQMAEVWKDLNFGGKSETDISEAAFKFNPDHFKTPSRMIEKLRMISRAGRAYTDQINIEVAGRPKIVLGSHEPPVNEVIPGDFTMADFEERTDTNDVPVDQLPYIVSEPSPSAKTTSTLQKLTSTT